jgi:hypothetical protein
MGWEEDAKKNDMHKHRSVRQLRGPFSGQLESRTLASWPDLSRSKQGLTCRRDSLLLMPLLFSLLSFPVAAQEIGTLGGNGTSNQRQRQRPALGIGR